MNGLKVINSFIDNTNEVLLQKGWDAVRGKRKAAYHPINGLNEAFKFFGILRLITRFEFEERAELWSEDSPFDYVPTANLGKTGMSRNRFDAIFSCQRYSSQPEECPNDMTDEQYR